MQRGKALLSAALDNVASETEHLFTLIARDAAAGVKFWEVTFQALANTINLAAWWLGAALGEPELFSHRHLRGDRKHRTPCTSPRKHQSWI